MIDEHPDIVPPWLIMLLVIFNVMLGAAAYLILLERKIASWVQDRIGPNRVGPRGLLQPMADGLKMFMKEDYRSPDTDKWLFSLAPVLMMLVVFTADGGHPLGRHLPGHADADRGRSAAAAQLAAERIPAGRRCSMARSPATGNANEYVATYRYAVPDRRREHRRAVGRRGARRWRCMRVVFGGWASNNKFSFLGGMRAAAQMISYEVPLGLSILTIVLMFGTLSLTEIIAAQAHYWAASSRRGTSSASRWRS